MDCHHVARCSVVALNRVELDDMEFETLLDCTFGSPGYSTDRRQQDLSAEARDGSDRTYDGEGDKHMASLQLLEATSWFNMGRVNCIHTQTLRITQQ